MSLCQSKNEVADAATALGADAGSVTPCRATTRLRVVDVNAQHHTSSREGSDMTRADCALRGNHHRMGGRLVPTALENGARSGMRKSKGRLGMWILATGLYAAHTGGVSSSPWSSSRQKECRRWRDERRARRNRVSPVVTRPWSSRWRT